MADPTTSTANQDKLRSYLAGVDHDTLGDVVFDWQYVPPPLDQTRDYLKDSARDESTLGKLGRGLATTLATAFHGTSEHLNDRSALITPAAKNLGLVVDALKAAQDHLDTWAAKPLTPPPAKPNPNDPQYDTTNPDNVNADGTPKAGHDFNQADTAYQTASSNYATDNGQREQIAAGHVAAIDSAMATATASMKAIHQQPDPTSSGGTGTGGGGTRGGLPVGGTPTPITLPPRGTSTPPPTTTEPPPVVVGPGHHPPVGPGGPGGGTNPPHNPGGGWSGPGNGSTWNGSDPTVTEPSTSGFPGGVGLGAAVLGGGLVAGAGGFAGLRALGGTLAEEGGLGMSARGAGAPSVLGKGGAAAALEEEGAGGARAGAGGTGGRGAGAAGGRGRGKGKKRPEGEHGDLWDDGEDWIDDEGAAPGVLD